MIAIELKSNRIEDLKNKYPNSILVDITMSTGHPIYKRLSPYYCHWKIKVPYSSGYTASSVASIWEGLKVFENCGIDTNTFKKRSVVDIKRSSNVYGKYLGHQIGVNGKRIIDLVEARKKILIPAYRFQLDYKVQEMIKWIRDVNEAHSIILLDNTINFDLEDTSSPISHAFLLKAYVEGLFPYEDAYENVKIQHVYIGRNYRAWTENIRRVKAIPIENELSKRQLVFDFDD